MELSPLPCEEDKIWLCCQSRGIVNLRAVSKSCRDFDLVKCASNKIGVEYEMCILRKKYCMAGWLSWIAIEI